MRLEDLSPELSPAVYPGAQVLAFRCPNCRQRLVTANIWSGPQSTLEYEPGKNINLHHAEQGPNCDWATLTVTPSIDSQHGKPSASGCTGWHGHITKGIVG